MMNTGRIYKDHVPGWLNDLIAKLKEAGSDYIEKVFEEYASTGAIRRIAEGRFYGEGFIFDIIKKGITSDMILRNHPDVVFVQNICFWEIFIQITYTMADISSIPIFPGHISECEEEELPEHLSELVNNLQGNIRGSDVLYARLYRLCDDPANDFRRISDSRFITGSYIVDVLRLDVPAAFDWTQFCNDIRMIGNIPVPCSNLFVQILKHSRGMDFAASLPEARNADSATRQTMVESSGKFWVSSDGKVSQPEATGITHIFYLCSTLFKNKLKNFRIKKIELKLHVSEIEMVFPEDRSDTPDGDIHPHDEFLCARCTAHMRHIQAQEPVIDVQCNNLPGGLIEFRSVVIPGDNGDADYFGIEPDLNMIAYMNLSDPYYMTPFAPQISRECDHHLYLTINNMPLEDVEKAGIIKVKSRRDFYNHGYYVAKREDYLGIVDSTLNVIIPFEYTAIYIFSNATAKVENKEGATGVLDMQNRMIIPPKYRFCDISYLDDKQKDGGDRFGHYRVRSSGQEIIYDMDGNSSH